MTMWGEVPACSFPITESTYVVTDAWGYFLRYYMFRSPAVTILWWSTVPFMGVFFGKFEAIFLAVSHPTATIFQPTLVPGYKCAWNEGGEGVVSRVKPRSMSYGCGTVVLCYTVLPGAERYSSRLGAH